MSSEQFVPTRHTLLRRLRNWGDQTSWEDFANTYSKQIYEISLRAGLNDSEAKDVLQETLVAVAKKVGEFKAGREHGSFRVWLLQATRWRIADQFRKRLSWRKTDQRYSVEGPRTAIMNAVPDPASLDLEAAWDEGWRRNIAEAALRKIKNEVDPEQYQIFHLHIVKEWRAREVAKRLGVTLSHVYFASYKITRLLKKEIRYMQRKFS